MRMKADFNDVGFDLDGLLHLTGKQALICLKQHDGLPVSSDVETMK